MYTLVITPRHPLEIGTLVHLHSIIYAVGWDSKQSNRHPLEESTIIPLAIRGPISGERSRTRDGVELVVDTDDPHAPIQRAFIHIQCRHDSLPQSDRAALASQRVPKHPAAKPESLYTHSWRYKAVHAPVPSEQRHSSTSAAPTEPPPPPPGPPMVMDLRYARDPSHAHAFAATQPYNIWEPYPKIKSQMVPDVSVRSRADAIRNYGVPIVVRPPGARREPRDARLDSGSEWNYPGGRWGLQDRHITEDD
ncbi:uncharacterized protein TRAVEDRAFT_47173 [Trametes versicolor FP-101664 SS1]|uniref:uncharacterized protein n=1 Tax=Trametes versicolor (strain FP-101664) TaxID=717944 RepID=UPI00046239B8|nr:uncharacterized protein TRAVEDRAFT_47173 [Trametes versicolor FP-101664 SS1]EIW59871.1 hypothetical protein TRAVEDRAFT_47173 [Trametes versicolor FP-101664 SS1]